MSCRRRADALVCVGLSSGQNEIPVPLETSRSREKPELANSEPEEDEEELRDAISKAEHEAMEARADYVLRNKIIENVVIADPVLKAVHGGRDETFADRYV